MSTLRDRPWAPKYHSDAGELVRKFYEPMLARARRYDRSTGYFSARILSLASRGIAELVRNEGRMRLVVGCTLEAPEVEAIAKGESLTTKVREHLQANPLEPRSLPEAEALELLAWMVAQGILEVKLAIPCEADRRPCAATGIFHEKAGIVEDADGDRLAFNGSVNETAAAWMGAPFGNWESFHVFTSWGPGSEHLEAEEESFARLWNDRAEHARIVDVGTAIREDLLRFLPPDNQQPKLLLPVEMPAESVVDPPKTPDPIDAEVRRRRVWAFLRDAPSWTGGGERVGEATAAIEPWPHQVRAFQRAYDHWPPRLLIADEVGLGKTIEAGLILRQAWLARRAKRMLVMAPAAVLAQWQIELREKFNLDWPIYDGGELRWFPSPARGEILRREVGRTEWLKEPFVLVSSQLMRRPDRARELLAAEPWDLIVLDEAHHARRRGAGGTGKDRGPNHLLRLMRDLKGRSAALLLLTATPMQVDPVELWDLMDLLGLPASWTKDNFTRYFKLVGQESPSHEDVDWLAGQFQVVEREFGQATEESVVPMVGGSTLAARKILRALRDPAVNPRRQLDTPRRKAALEVLRRNTPVGRLVSRHTRNLLRKMFAAGKITSRIATRQVNDRFVQMSAAERVVYDAVETYIATVYDRAGDKERNAVGFILTTYRRRLASSFEALEHTLKARLDTIRRRSKTVQARADRVDDLPEDEAGDDVIDVEEVMQLEQESITAEEQDGIQDLLRSVSALPEDTKAKELFAEVDRLRAAGFSKCIVFTQFTDTMDFLRDRLRKRGLRVMCYSGRGGELSGADGTWRAVTREEIKRRFRDDGADVLVATDAAAEGLNFQFCGALINYDMPWNPMRVEQRIGRIDRLGQLFETIEIVNLHYADTVEADVYRALGERIKLFTNFVGKLQPILASLPRRIASAALTDSGDRARDRAELVEELNRDVDARTEDGFDIDDATDASLEMPARDAARYDLGAMDAILNDPDLLPRGVEVSPMGNREYRWLAPGMPSAIRVTTRRELYEEHPGSVALWSPGSPVFPDVDTMAEGGEATPNDTVEGVMSR